MLNNPPLFRRCLLEASSGNGPRPGTMNFAWEVLREIVFGSRLLEVGRIPEIMGFAWNSEAKNTFQGWAAFLGPLSLPGRY